MANDLNRCEFIGRLARDPELKSIPSGDAVANFTLACGKSYKDKSGQKQERTEWVRCVAWRQLAELIGKYLTKGSQVYLSGEFQTRSYEQNGEKKYITEIVVSDIQFLGGKSDSQGQQQTGGQNDRSRQLPHQGGQPGPQTPMEDDIPF